MRYVQVRLGNGLNEKAQALARLYNYMKSPKRDLTTDDVIQKALEIGLRDLEKEWNQK